MRFKCERKDTPPKWYDLNMLPGPDGKWVIMISYGIIDPAGQETVMQEPISDYVGTYKECESAMEEKVKQRLALGYLRIQQTEDDPTGLKQP